MLNLQAKCPMVKFHTQNGGCGGVCWGGGIFYFYGFQQRWLLVCTISPEENVV